MHRSETEEKLSDQTRVPNPFCPVCAVAMDERRDGDKVPREPEEHMCLLSILNAFYAAARGIEGQVRS